MKSVSRVLLLGQLTGKKEKANPSHFFKFFLTSSTSGTFGFAPTQNANASAKPKEPLFAIAPIDFVSKRQITLKNKVQ
jgi:hypothetical protein